MQAEEILIRTNNAGTCCAFINGSAARHIRTTEHINATEVAGLVVIGIVSPRSFPGAETLDHQPHHPKCLGKEKPKLPAVLAEVMVTSASAVVKVLALLLRL